MTVQIINYGAFIRISIDSSILLVAKSQVKIVEVIRDDTIRINIGEGPLKEILIRLYDVTFPAGLIDIAEFGNLELERKSILEVKIPATKPTASLNCFLRIMKVNF